MWKRRRIWLLLIALIGVALAVYFEPSQCVRGWLWGEAFFDGRPTSYWRTQVDQDLRTDPMVFIAGPITPPSPSLLERCRTAVGMKTKVDSSFRLVQKNDADAVLRQLAEDDSAQVAGFARDVLQGVRAQQPFVDETNDEYIAWLRLLCKNRAEPQDFDEIAKKLKW